MADQTVKLQDTGAAKVAFDLMHLIASYEKKPDHERTREYWLTLYEACRIETR
tara:strand:- start:162032 stop:162190 length:159 start_codon:yes stop_codon:yes gene_type:complete